MKKRNRYNKWVMAVCALFLTGGAGAQGVFAWRAALDTIPRDGFYQIELLPALVGKCSKADLGDLRILGPDNRFVSYVLKGPGKNDTGKKWLSVPAAVMAQKDSSNKHTYIDLRFSEAYAIDWFRISIRDPVFYERDAEVLAEETDSAEWTSVTSVTLTPITTRLPIPTVKARRVRLDILNGDNAPLVVNEITSFQLSRYLLAYLKAGKVYEVLTGDPQATTPDYDLKYFTYSLPATLSTLKPGPLQPVSVANAAPGAKTAGGEHSGSVLLWSILLAILILLVYFSARMIKVITKKERHDRV